MTVQGTDALSHLRMNPGTLSVTTRVANVGRCTWSGRARKSTASSLWKTGMRRRRRRRPMDPKREPRQAHSDTGATSRTPPSRRLGTLCRTTGLQLRWRCSTIGCMARSRGDLSRDDCEDQRGLQEGGEEGSVDPGGRSMARRSCTQVRRQGWSRIHRETLSTPVREALHIEDESLSA